MESGGFGESGFGGCFQIAIKDFTLEQKGFSLKDPFYNVIRHLE